VLYHGCRITVDLRDNVQREIFYFGAYEYSLLALLVSELEPSDTFVDVGAHVGAFSLPIARHLKNGRVFAFEPAPDTAALLQRNADTNGLRTLTVVKTALGAGEGVVDLRESPDWMSQDLAVRSLHGTGTLVARVPLTRFDSWACESQITRIDAVKIDVEGNELDVLSGMANSIEQHRPRLIVVEIVPEHLYRAGVSPAEVREHLFQLGYEAQAPTVEEMPSGSEDAYWPNVIVRRRVRPT